MKAFVLTVLTGLSLVVSSCTPSQHRPPLTITYVANTGFMIDRDGRKILVDALFDGVTGRWCYSPPDSVVDLLRAAQPPFDSVDLIAVTHTHIDHFDPDLVSAHLKHNSQGILVCPEQGREKLRTSRHYPEIQDRIRFVSAPVDSMVAMEIAGIDVMVLTTQHSPYYEEDETTGETVDRHADIQHLEFVFTVGGRTLYHCGDSPMNDRERYERFGFGNERIDLAFLPWWDMGERLTFRQLLIRDVIRPEAAIMMHLIPGREPSGEPEKDKTIADTVIVPREPLEQWIIR